MSLPSAAELKGTWQQQVTAANLLQERYAVSRDAAGQQAKSVLAQLK